MAIFCHRDFNLAALKTFYDGKNMLPVILGNSEDCIPDSVQNSDLESTMASVLSVIYINVESREVDDCHRIGKSNNGSKKNILDLSIRSIARKHSLTGSNWRELILKNIC